MKNHIALTAAALLALGTVGSAFAADKAPASKDPGKARNQCFWTRMVNGFAAPDEHTLYVRVGVRDVYKFEMFGPCPGIDWNERLALVSHPTDQICDGMDAEVITHSPGLGHQRCMVRSVRKLTPEEVAALPKHARP